MYVVYFVFLLLYFSRVQSIFFICLMIDKKKISVETKTGIFVYLVLLVTNKVQFTKLLFLHFKTFARFLYDFKHLFRNLNSNVSDWSQLNPVFDIILSISIILRAYVKNSEKYEERINDESHDVRKCRKRERHL